MMFLIMSTRLLIDNANTLGDVSYVKKVQDAVPVAHATDFFNNLKNSVINGIK